MKLTGLKERSSVKERSCSICGANGSTTKLTLDVKLDVKEEEEVRGVLCSYCLFAVHIADQNPSILTKIKDYIS